MWGQRSIWLQRSTGGNYFAGPGKGRSIRAWRNINLYKWKIREGLIVECQPLPQIRSADSNHRIVTWLVVRPATENLFADDALTQQSQFAQQGVFNDIAQQMLTLRRRSERWASQQIFKSSPHVLLLLGTQRMLGSNDIVMIDRRSQYQVCYLPTIPLVNPTNE